MTETGVLYRAREVGTEARRESRFTLAQWVTNSRASRQGGNPHTIDTDESHLARAPRETARLTVATIQASDIRATSSRNWRKEYR